MHIHLNIKEINEQIKKEVGLYTISKVKVENFENCLSVLDEIERSIIERKFLTGAIEKDIGIYLDLGMNKDKFYQKKRSAYSKFAKALGII